MIARLWARIGAWAGWSIVGAVLVSVLAGMGLQWARERDRRLRAEGARAQEDLQRAKASEVRAKLAAGDAAIDARRLEADKAAADQAAAIRAESDAEATAKAPDRIAAARRARGER